MAKAAGLSKATAQRPRAANDIKPHVTKTFKVSHDPALVEKFWDVIGLRSLWRTAFLPEKVLGLQATQSQRGNIYKHVCQNGGSDAVWQNHQKNHFGRGGSAKATPFAANNFRKAMRSLFKWAVASDFVVADPTEGVAGPGHKTDGFHVWTEEEISRRKSANC